MTVETKRCEEEDRNGDAINDPHHSTTTNTQQQTERIFSSPISKLYCRGREQEILFEAYRRSKTPDELIDKGGGRSYKIEFVVVHAPTGYGKSALAHSLKSTVLKDGGFFVVGKFDAMQRLEPHSAFLTALRQLAGDILQRGDDCITDIRDRVNRAIGSDAKVLVDMIPTFGTILNLPIDVHSKTSLSLSSSKSSSTPSSEAFNRLRYVFRNFVWSLASLDRPLVFLLDDLHWADETCMGLLQSLLTGAGTGGVLIVGTFRDDVDQSHRAFNMLSRINKNQVNLSMIELGKFDQDGIQEMICDLMQMDDDQSRQVAALVHSQTKGIAFFVLEFLRALYENRVLRRDPNCDGRWIFDDEERGSDTTKVNPQNIRDLIKHKIEDLSVPAQETLKVAACLGADVDEGTLQKLLSEQASVHLKLASDKGLTVFDPERKKWFFSHDGVQETAYQLIDTSDRISFHYRLGRKLWNIFSLEELDYHIFLVVGELLIGKDLVKKGKESVAIAKLCLRAAERSVKLSSFQTAFVYAKNGIALLGSDCWDVDYDLCLQLHDAAAEIAYCNADFAEVERLVKQTLDNAHTFDDTIRGTATKVYALGSSGQMVEAIRIGLDALKILGETFPRRPTVFHVQREFWIVKRRLRKKSNSSILRLPFAEDNRKIAAMQLLNLLFLYALMAQPLLAPLVGLRIVTITLDYGLCTVSCLGILVYGMILCGFGGDVNEGYRMGQLSFTMYDIFKTEAWLGRIYAAFYGSIYVWKRPIREILEPIKVAHRVSLESGDIEVSMINAAIYCWCQIDISPLPKLNKDLIEVSERMEFFGQKMALSTLRPYWQLVLNLMGMGNENPTILVGDVCDDHAIADLEEMNESSFRWSHFHRLLAAYALGDYVAAELHLEHSLRISKDPIKSGDSGIVVYMNALTILAQTSKRVRVRVQKAKQLLRMLRQWAKLCPLNCLGKQFIIEAEIARLRKDIESARAKYTCAIALSKEGGFIMQTALANELTCRFLLDQNELCDARHHFDESIAYYERWGSPVIIKSLHQRYDHKLGITKTDGLPN